VLVVVWFVEPNSFKSRIESAVKDATGRELSLRGDIELRFFPWLALRAGEGSLANPPGFGTDPMVSWREVQLGARLFPLLRGELVADRVTIRGADLRLVRRADGAANWEGLGGADDGAAPGDPMEIRIGGISVEDSRISFVDETAGGRAIRVDSLELSTDEIVPGEPITDTEIAGVLHLTGFATEGVPFRVEVPRLSAPRDFSRVEVETFEVGFGDLELEGAVRGSLGEQPRLEGRMDTNVFDLRALMASIGMKAPATTDPEALRRLEIAGNWAFEEGAMKVEPVRLRLDDTRFAGLFRLNVDEEAAGHFELRGDRIAISRYIPPPDPTSEPFVLPTAALKELQFSGLVELEEATLDEVVMKGVSLRLLLDDEGLRAVEPERNP
jgi:AsmA protein